MCSRQVLVLKFVWIVGVGLSIASTGAMAAEYSGGTGTQADPYQIGRAGDWTTLFSSVEDWGKHFILTASIDFSGAVLMPVGNLEVQFTGVFNGDGYVLSNGQINLPGIVGTGLFGYVGEGGKIQDVGVEGVDVTGGSSVGGLAGSNSGSIVSCYTTGAATAVDEGDTVGGLIGQNSGTVTFSHASGQAAGDYYVGGLVGQNDGTVSSCYASCVVSGNAYVGGLMGENLEAAVTSCYAAGPVTGNAYVAGLIGDNKGPVRECYARGPVHCGAGFCLYIGGLMGYDWSESVTSSYWDMEATGQAVSGGGEGRTTAEMTYPYAENTYVGWDFAAVWAEDEESSINDGYPYLREKAPSEPHPADVNTDYRIVLSEAIAYLAGWQQGSNPIGYAIRAAFLWQNGEAYVYDDGDDPPMCWILAPR